MSTIITLIGIGCLIGAIIGGGVKLQVVEMRTFDSLWRQFLLAIFGAGLLVYGLTLQKEAERNRGVENLPPVTMDAVEAK